MRSVLQVLALTLLVVVAAENIVPQGPSLKPLVINEEESLATKVLVKNEAVTEKNEGKKEIIKQKISEKNDTQSNKVNYLREGNVKNEEPEIKLDKELEKKLALEHSNPKKQIEIPITNAQSVKEQNKNPVAEQSLNASSIQESLSDKEDSEKKQKVTYNGAKVLRVVIQNKEQKKMIRQMENKGEISTWSGNGTAVDILVKQEKIFDLLDSKKLIYDVIINDLQKAIEEENPPIPQDEWSELEGRKVEPYSWWTGNEFLSPYYNWWPKARIIDTIDYDDTNLKGLKKTKRKKKKKKKRRGHRMTWQMYHRMSDIHGYIDYLTATYPDICSQETIGYSVEGRPLKVLKISSGEPKAKAMWVDSGIHAREWITPATSTFIISQIIENGDGSHGVDWYFLPLVNPDGYEHSHTTDRLWRKNRANSHKGPCAGTDLNRNFGYRWGGQGSSQQPCRETYAGSGPFSEPETNAINRFVMSKSKELGAYVSLHSYGQYILYPWGYDRKVPPDYSDLHRVGRAMAQSMRSSGGQIYRVGSAAATLYPASGGSDDWAKGIAKIKYTYTIELRDTGRHGFVLPAQYIQPTAKEAYEALKTLASEVQLL